MPILEQISVDAPFSQGDVLEGVRLFATKESWNTDGGQAGIANSKLCLVVSRPCVATNKQHVIVAGVEQYKGNVPADIKDFDDLLGFLTATRDAVESPDVFYLGDVPGRSGRFCARLDSLHSVQVPVDHDARLAFLNHRRLARLHPDFARDLHARIFRAFASLGFDDIHWFSTEDLQWLVDRGRADIAGLEQELLQRQTTKGQKAFEGGQFPQAQVEALQVKLVALRRKIVPYEAELQGRRP